LHAEGSHFLQDAVAMEREARRRLPVLLAELLDEPDLELAPADAEADRRFDVLAADGRGRQWLVEIKSSSRPGQIDSAAAQLRGYAEALPEAIPLLLVPYMTAAGAETADRARLNWLDLSGNAHIRAENLHVWVQGRPNELRSRGRPSSPFAPKSARITRTLLLDPAKWWRQRDLVRATGLDDGNVSRIVRRLDDELLLEHRDRELRPRNPDLLLDAWAEDYSFERHDIVVGHLTGAGIDLARQMHLVLDEGDIQHAYTGLVAAWLLEPLARFRLVSVYVSGDPRDAADMLRLRRNQSGANIQLVGPNDAGVFDGGQTVDGLPCVPVVQTYLDLLHLPERASDAARQLRDDRLLWRAAG
jgi:Transcriptional regulator, AbiEi antitoxin, Type IV TA system